MGRYRVAQVGLGRRGHIHIDGFLHNSDRFDLVGLCDLDEGRLREAAEEYQVSTTYASADAMLSDLQPDVFCFVTQPDTRLALVQLAAKHGVKAIAFEKPMATSLREAWAITSLCREHNIKAVVSHQQKYLTSMQQLKQIVDRGEIGEVMTVRATTLAWLSQLGTHYMDYIIWANGGSRAKWAVGHIHGKDKLDDSHPSPDYLMGQVAFANGVRGFIECGYLTASHMDTDKFWLDNRLSVQGTHGHVWADTDGRWGALTKTSRGETVGGTAEPWEEQETRRLQRLYLAELADWLDDGRQVHSCNVDQAYHGYEILEAICLSALGNTRVDLPLESPGARDDILKRMRKELPAAAIDP